MRVLILRDSETGQLAPGESSVEIHLNGIVASLKRFAPEIELFSIDSKNLDFYIAESNGRKTRFDSKEVFDVLISSPYALDGVEILRAKRLVLRTFISLPAIWWYEHPENYSVELLLKMIRLLNSEFISFIVPNENVADYLERFSLLHLGAKQKKRIFTFPYTSEKLISKIDSNSSVVVGSKIDFGQKNFVEIIDVGGCWGWTANDIFVEAFMDHVDEVNSKLRLTIFGKPQSNPYLSDVEIKINELMSEHGQSVHLRKLEWQSTSNLQVILESSHFGLSLNKSSIEGFLSSRVRVLSYLENEIKPVMTSESSWKNICGHGNVIVVEPGYEDFRELLRELEKTEIKPHLDYGLIDISSRNAVKNLLEGFEKSAPFPSYVHGKSKTSMEELTYFNRFLPPLVINQNSSANYSSVDSVLLLEVIKQAFADPYFNMLLTSMAQTERLSNEISHLINLNLGAQGVKANLRVFVNAGRKLVTLIPKKLVEKFLNSIKGGK